jgi:hypothetical protein
LEKEDPNEMLFQQDELPPHLHKEVTGLFQKFPEKWIGLDFAISFT